MKKPTRNTTLGAAVAAGLLAGITARADYSTTVLGDNPAAYWRFSEMGVAPSIDYATNSGTFGFPGYGEYREGVIHPVTGALASDPSNAAARMPNVNGSSGGPARVRIPWQADLNANSAFSVEFWAKPAATNDIGCPAASADFNASTRYGWLFYQGPGNLTGGNGWFFRLYHSAGNTFAATAVTLDTNLWYHLVGTYDGVNTIKLYVNGVPVATSTMGGTYTPNVSRTDVPMTFGGRGDGAAGNYGWGGDLDEATYYTRTLSDADVLAHYQAGTNPSPAIAYATLVQNLNPAVYLRLNEPLFTLPVAANSGSLGTTGNGNYRYWSTTTTDLVGPTYPGFATDNRTLQTSGTNGFVAAPALNLNANTVTMECWIKRNGDQGDYNGVLFHRGGGGTATGIMFRDSSALNNLGYHWNDTYYSWNSSLVPPDGAWAYVALAVSPDQAVMYLYDGTNWSSSANVASHGVQAFAATTRVATDDGAGRFFNGLVDEAAIYGKTLTEGELRTHALAGFGDPAHNKPTLVTDPPAVAPSGTIYSTTPFSLTADAYGEPPLTFQWQHEGTNLPSGTTRTFARTAAGASDAGSYAVIVGNAYGYVTSSIVSVAINAAVPPTITNAPLSRSVYAGGTASFTVGAEGTTPMSYQWKHAGTNLPGATNATLLVTGVDETKTGSYSVTVTNVAGTAPGTATLTTRTPAANSYEALVAGSGPISYWRLGESSGEIAFDYMGGNDGRISGGVSQGATGLASPAYPGLETSNRGYGFDGTGSVLVGNPASLNFAGQITMMAWVRPSVTDGLRNIVCHGYQTSPNNAEVGLRVNGTVYTAWSWDNGAEASFTIPAEDIGNWVQIVGTHDGTGWRLYHNGVEVAYTATTAGAKVVSDTGWAIGARGTGTERFWNGDVDEVAIYNKTLSADMIATMYATAAYGTTTPPFVTRNPAAQSVAVGSTVTVSGAVAGSLPISYQWKKDGVNVPGATNSTISLTSVYFTDAGSYVLWATNGVGYTNTTAATLSVLAPPSFANLTNDLVLHLRFDGDYADTSGRANDASAPGGNPPFLAGKIGQGVHIATTPGVNHLVISDNAGDLAFDETASFTVGFWIKYTSGFNDVPIIGNAINSTWQLGWVFTDSATAGKIEWSLASTANSGTYLRDPVPGCPTINDGTWHQVLGVVDRTAELASVYIDGAFAGSWSIKGLGSLSPGNNITIGSDPTGVYGSTTFGMDDLGIWRRALTAYEAASVYGAAQTSGSSFDTIAPVKVFVKQVGGYVDVSWQAGTLLQSTSVDGGYTPVQGAAAPFHRITPGTSPMFFRVKQ